MVLSLSAILRDAGFETRGAYRGAEALDAFRDFEPDAVLLDIGIPDISGYDVAREIRKQTAANQPLLIAVTGWKKASDRMLAQMAGFDHHISKPYDSQALVALLEGLHKAL